MATFRGQRDIRPVPLGEIFNPFSQRNVQAENARIRRENETRLKQDARQRITEPRVYLDKAPVPLGERLNILGQGPTQYANQRVELENEMRFKQNESLQRRQAREAEHQMHVDARRQLEREIASGMPQVLRGNPIGQGLANVAARTRYGVTHIPVLPAAGAAAGVAGLGVLGSGAVAYGQLTDEGLPAGPFSVAGRIATNTVDAMGGAIGMDPLARARQNVQEAERILGDRAVVDAVMDAELGTTGRFGNQYEFEAEVDAKASELMQMGHKNSDGEFVPTKPKDAYELAYKIVSQKYNINENVDY